MTNCENSVYDKNSMMDNVDFSYVTVVDRDFVYRPLYISVVLFLIIYGVCFIVRRAPMRDCPV